MAGVEVEAARARIESYSRLGQIPMDTDDLLAAIDLRRLHGWSIWDSLIVQAAIKCGCDMLYTEDLQHRRRISGVEIVNPFSTALPNEVNEPDATDNS